MLSLQAVSGRGESASPALCANAHGFSLHAAVRLATPTSVTGSNGCAVITRPAIANERLKGNRTGDVVLRLKSAYRDGTTHVVMSPLEFMRADWPHWCRGRAYT